MKEDGLPRGSWKLAKIENLIEGDVDQVQQAAELMTPTGKRFNRPFRMLYPLEGTNVEINEENTNNKEIIKEKTIINKDNAKPMRMAAEIARNKIRQTIQ